MPSFIRELQGGLQYKNTKLNNIITNKTISHLRQKFLFPKRWKKEDTVPLCTEGNQAVQAWVKELVVFGVSCEVKTLSDRCL